jgi:hypothetical protein
MQKMKLLVFNYQQLDLRQVAEDKKKLVQFTSIFSLLSKGKPMIDYEDFKPLFEFLKLRSIPKKHWTNGVGWEMSEHIKNEVKKASKTIIQNAKFVSLKCDEVISMDNASWANVHGYIVQDWCYIPLLLNVKHAIFGSKVNSITLLIMNSLMTERGSQEEDLTTKMVCFGVDGVITFQGLRSRIIVQIQQQYAPFVIGVHCMAHQINLAVQTFSHLPLISRIETFWQCLYVYFSHGPKRHLEFTKLAKIMETKSNKIL